MNNHLVGIRIKRINAIPVNHMVSVQEEKQTKERRGWFYECTNLDFSKALMYLKKGKKLIREGWNGKHQYISLIAGLNTFKEDMTVYDLARFENIDNSEIVIKPFIAIVVNDNEVTPWFASQADLLAEDWCVVS